MRTARLHIRPATEGDRGRFVELFTDESFMVFTDTGALGHDEAHRRFDRMHALEAEVPFAKQAVIEASTGRLVGYAGVDTFDFRGERRFEFGYRLVTGARGRGYATESAQALLDLARQTWRGELLGLIDPRNDPSRRVLCKLGFAFVERTPLMGRVTEIHTLVIG